jgi:nucleoside diphosphate kinase
MIKPDGVQRGLVGRIIARFEDRGLKLVGLKMLLADEDLLMEHYAELRVGRRDTWSLYLTKVSFSSAKFRPEIGAMASLS